MNHNELKDIVQGHFAEYLSRFKDRIDARGPLSIEDTSLFQSTLQTTNTAIEDKQYDIWFPEMDDRLQTMVQKSKPSEHLSKEDIETARTLYLQGNRAYFERALNYSFEAGNLDLEKGQVSKLVSKKTLSVFTPLEDLVSQYVEEQSRSSEGWSRTTKDERNAQLQILIEMLGKDFNLFDLTLENAKNIKSLILKRPRNQKRKKSKGIGPILLPLDNDLLSNATVNNYLNCYSSFNKWAKDNGFTDKEDMFGSLKLRRKRGETKKHPFSSADMQKILSNLSALRSKNEVIDHHYWAGMIAAYTGARLNEICSLYKKNIRQIEGVWIFEIADEMEDQSVKTDASIRKVPIHSKLIEQGFLKFHGSCLHDRIFPNLPYHYKDKYGRNVGRWWNEKFLVEIGVKTKEKTFHCFRHTVSSHLQFLDVQEPLIRAIVGHEQSGTLQKHYTGGVFKIPQLKEVIEKLRYD